MELLMNINLLLPLLVLLAAWRAWRGCKNGFAEEVYRLISLIAALLVLALLLMAVASFRENDIKNGVIAVALLLIAGILLHLFGIIMKSLKAIARLPVISLLNSLLGLAAGIAEIIIAAWIMYCIIQNFPTGGFGDQIMTWTQESEWLTKLYDANRISLWLKSFAEGSASRLPAYKI
ncbi:MAG TPA: CvpA family protein [Candidatus Eisenbergiella pullistercoris]|uniref:CvpA family protein n=1 Tax=Candidatus Eisenbergiella pullistercoris TaxID=2838555 RepID=A0A9D1YRK7_9FIRM|nr:CvpA family protein [Candidatus Eisenbergiella pullistercoris]